MEEQLISFETAKLAKDKRFYTNTTGVYEWQDSCEIVPQSLLQRWLRDMHQIEIYVRPSFQTLSKYVVVYMKWRKDRKFREQYFIVPLNDKLEPGSTHKNFNTYEEALEKGLQEALKLINNV